MGIVYPYHFLLWWGLMGISMNFHGFGDYLFCWRLFVLDTPPKTSIFGYLRIKADQLTQGEGYGRVTDSSEGQGHMPYVVNHVLLKVKVGHLTTLSPSLLLFHFDLELGEVTPNLCWMVWQIYFFKLIPKVNGKTFGIQLKNTVFYGHRYGNLHLVKVGYYPLMPLACASI